MVVYRPYTIQHCTRAAMKACNVGSVIMSEKRLIYSLEFKLEVVKAAREMTIHAAAKSTKSKSTKFTIPSANHLLNTHATLL